MDVCKCSRKWLKKALSLPVDNIDIKGLKIFKVFIVNDSQ